VLLGEAVTDPLLQVKLYDFGPTVLVALIGGKFATDRWLLGSMQCVVSMLAPSWWEKLDDAQGWRLRMNRIVVIR
jgi:hypothetical protein